MESLNMKKGVECQPKKGLKELIRIERLNNEHDAVKFAQMSQHLHVCSPNDE